MPSDAQRSISVIIPAYNAEATIGLCLDALARSILPSTEVIVVDDGSTDATAVIAAEKSAKVVCQKNAGAAAARNRGARESAGEYLYFLDSDVVVPPDALAQFLDTALAYDVDLVVGRYSTEPMNPSIAAHYKALADYVLYIPRRLRHTVYLDGQIGGGGDFISRRAFESCGGFSTSIKGASVEREEFYVRFYEAGFHSAANPNIKTRHFFPSMRSLLRNYVRRIHDTNKLMLRSKPKFTYIRKVPLIAPPFLAFLAAVSLAFLAPPLNAFAAVCCAVALLASSWDFLWESLTRKGILLSLVLFPVHLFVLAFILGVAAISLAGMKAGLISKEI